MSDAPSYEEATSERHRPGHHATWEEIGNGRICVLCGYIERLRREYAVRNPYSGAVMTVPDDSLSNAVKMAELVPESKIMTRTVTEWVEHV